MPQTFLEPYCVLESMLHVGDKETEKETTDVMD